MTPETGQGPVNPTNPNALENQPSGNGNAESLLKPILSQEAEEVHDSNIAVGSQKIEPSLSSKPEATGKKAADENDLDENSEEGEEGEEGEEEEEEESRGDALLKQRTTGKTAAAKSKKSAGKTASKVKK